MGTTNQKQYTSKQAEQFKKEAETPPVKEGEVVSNGSAGK